jgi:hypothetical protein
MDRSMTADLDLNDDDDRWIVSGVDPGPAGAVAVRLGGSLLSVDAADPSLLVETSVYPTGQQSRPAEEDLRLIESLFGQEVTDWLRHAHLGDRRTASTIAGPAWQAAGGLAVSKLTQRFRRPASALAVLDTVLHAQRIDHPAARQLVRKEAWKVLPALVALACASDRHPELVSGLSPEARRALRERVEVVRGVLAAEGLGQRSEPAVNLLDKLVARLEPPRDQLEADLFEQEWRELTERLETEEEAPTDEQLLASVGPRYEAAPSDDSIAPSPQVRAAIPLTWEADVLDVQVRMGEGADVLIDRGRCRGSGHLPGNFWASLPLRLGVESEDLAGVSIRLLTRKGALLGRAPLRVVPTSSELPRAAATVTVPSVEPDVLAAVAEHGIVVDVAVDSLPDLDSGAIARLTRGQGLRAGQEAVAAAAAGQRKASIEAWRRCARLLHLAGEHDLAVRADGLAEQATSVPLQGDWLDQLLAAWVQVTRKVLARVQNSQSGRDERSELVTLVRELSTVLDVEPELAAAHALLGRLLLESAEQAVAEENEDDRLADASGHLREAVRIYATLGADHEARRVLRNLRSIS